jgi:hypothetical protein
MAGGVAEPWIERGIHAVYKGDINGFASVWNNGRFQGLFWSRTMKVNDNASAVKQKC